MENTQITLAESKQIAGEILKQLGGSKFIAMTGATNFVCDGYSMMLKFKGSKIANYLKVTLNATDTYTVEFAKLWNCNIKWVSKTEGIYNDMLQELFTEVTGLYTSLGTMGR